MTNFINQQFFPGLCASRAKKKLDKKFENEKKYTVNTKNINSKERKNYIEQVKFDLEKQVERNKRIEEKAKSLLFIIAVVFTAITFSLNYIKDIFVIKSQIIAIIFLFVSILYLIFGSIRTLQALNLRQYAIHQIEVDKGDNEYFVVKKPSEKELLDKLIKIKQLNDLVNINQSNFVYAAFISIRNGIIIFLIFYLTTVGISSF